MLARSAFAIASSGGDPFQPNGAIGRLVRNLPAARAILIAMRGPTTALLDAMMAAVSTTRDKAAIWNAAIEAALEETVG